MIDELLKTHWLICKDLKMVDSTRDKEGLLFLCEVKDKEGLLLLIRG
jgi:hypothetical protein